MKLTSCLQAQGVSLRAGHRFQIHNIKFKARPGSIWVGAKFFKSTISELARPCWVEKKEKRGEEAS